MLTESSVKPCSKCGVLKPLGEFYRRAASNDGRQLHCLVCDKAKAQARYASPEGRRAKKEYNAVHNALPAVKAARRARDASPEGRAVQRTADAKYRADHPVQRAAAMRLNYEVKMARVTKPDSCAKCDAVARLDAHHHDYAQPLNVAWLCRPCHKAWHTEHGPGING